MPELTIARKKKTGWTTVAFGDVVRQVKDKVDPEKSGLTRYVAGEHIDTDDLRIRRWGMIGDGYLGPAFHMRFKPGHVLYCSRRTYLRKVAVADFEGITANTTYVLESADPKVLLPELLPFIMQTEAFTQHSIRESKGSVNPYVNFSDLTWFEFALPPIDEQRRMVTVLEAAREVVNTAEQLLIQAKQVRLSSIFAFEARVPVDGQLSSLITTLESGKSPPSTGEEATAGRLGVLKVSAVGDWEYVPSEAKAVAAGDFMPDLAVQNGDLLIARANADPDSVGRSCIVVTTRDGLMLSDKTWRAHLSAEADGLAYGILAWTKSKSFRIHVRNHLNGTDAKNISKARFLAGPAPKIDDAFRAFDEQVRALCEVVRSAAARLADARRCYRQLIEEVVVR